MFLLFAYRVLPQPAPIVRAFNLNVNTIITAGDATAGVSLPVCLVSSVCLCASLSASPAFLPSVLFNSYHYVSAKWNPFAIHLFYSLQASLFFRLDILPLSPSHSDCNGWNRESSLLLSCLFSYCLQPKPWQCCFWLAWGKWTLWHFTPWIVAAHGFSSKHCSLLPWQLMTKFQPPCTYLCQDFTQTGLSQNVQRDQSWEALFFFYFPILFSSVSLSLLSTM